MSAFSQRRNDSAKSGEKHIILTMIGPLPPRFAISSGKPRPPIRKNQAAAAKNGAD
jgi:hypothetical protein